MLSGIENAGPKPRAIRIYAEMFKLHHEKYELTLLAGVTAEAISERGGHVGQLHRKARMGWRAARRRAAEGGAAESSSPCAARC